MAWAETVLRYLQGLYYPESGRGYAFFSSLGPGITSLAGVGVIAGMWRRINCHEPRCWRVGRYHIGGGQFTVCARHHPGGRPQHHHITAAHHNHQQERRQAQ
jgi:hypothetical protein